MEEVRNVLSHSEGFVNDFKLRREETAKDLNQVKSVMVFKTHWGVKELTTLL